jgi:hypothetical protein
MVPALAAEPSRHCPAGSQGPPCLLMSGKTSRPPRRPHSLSPERPSPPARVPTLMHLPPAPGLVCDRGLTLGDLIGTLREFFSRLGLTKLRFKPAFNPYTEPSMEIFRWGKGAMVARGWGQSGHHDQRAPAAQQPCRRGRVRLCGCFVARQSADPLLSLRRAPHRPPPNHVLNLIHSNPTRPNPFPFAASARQSLLESPATRSSWASGSRWATAACSAPRCWSPWGCRQT